MTYVLPNYFNDITWACPQQALAAINLLKAGSRAWRRGAKAAYNNIDLRTPIFCGPEKSASFLAYKKEPHNA
ncbi:hypothetical protein [Herbaspirillum sp. RV1423]|uniref:hypothetical protein n=1 Tax=Herbaspirillum sp. RV1423 TaxID=1443993 RepID=UPI0004B79880|nr:hypothetical protein [Herbaspirillum sp. RV1423]